MRSCFEKHFKTEFCNRILFWYINPQRVTQTVELVNLLNNKNVSFLSHSFNKKIQDSFLFLGK